MVPTFIYALKDPETRAIRYLGVTSDPRKRLRHHLRDRVKNHRTNWIRDLKNRGLIPEMELLVTVPKAEAPAWEIKFITTARQMGLELVNGTDGGEGCFNPTPATRAKMSAAQRGKKASAETRARIGDVQRGRKASLTTRAKMSAASRGRKHTAESRARMSAGRMGMKFSSEHCAALSAAHLGVPHPLERCAAKSAYQKGRPWSASRRAAYEANK